MNKVVQIHPEIKQLHTIENGTVFRVIAPKIEGKKHVKNNSIYRKEGDSHCVQLSNGHDCIFDRATLVRPIPNSRFAGAVAIAVSA